MALTKVSGDFIQDGSITQGHLHSSHGITTSDIGEGSNLYFTTARVDSRIGDLSTSNLSEGTNLYYTDARARAAISVSGNALSYNSSTGVITSNFEESPTFTGNVTGSGYGLFQGSTGNAPTGSGTFIGLTNNYGNIQFNGSGGGHIDFASSGVDYAGRIIYFNSNNSFIIYTNAAQAITIDSSQNTTISGDLTVNGGDLVLGGTGRIQGIDTVSAGTDAANKTYVDNQVAGIVDSAPGTLDTLNELAAALGDDANFSTTVTNSIATKLPLAGGTLTGALQAQPWLFRQMSNQVEYHVLDNGSLNGPSWKFRYDGATANRYVDFGYKDGNGTYYAGLKLYNNSTISWKGTDIINASSQWVGGIASSGYNNTNWDTAYGWGNHASAGYLTSYTETDTLATVTARGASTSTAVTLSNMGNHYNGHFYWDAYSADGAHYPHFRDGSNANGVDINWRLYTGGTLSVNHLWNITKTEFRNQLHSTVDARAPIFYDRNDTNYYLNPNSTSQISQMAIGTTSWDTASLQLDVAGNASFRSGFYMGISTNNVNSWSGRIYVSGSSQYWNGQAWSFNGAGWGGGNYWTLDNSGNSIAYGSHRAPIFYDSNDTNYYCDPNGQSRLSTLNLGSSPTSGVTSGYMLQVRGGGIHMTNNDINYVGQLHFNDNVRFYDDGNDSYLNFKYGDSNYGGIKFLNGNAAQKGYIYADNSGFGILDNDGHWALRTRLSTNPLELYCDNNLEFEVHTSYTYSPGSSRAPIFYDSNNTGYYVDPNSASRLHNIVVGDGTPDTTPDGTTFSNTIKSTGGNTRVVNFEGSGTTISTWYTVGNTAYGAIDQGSNYMSFWQNQGSGWQEQFRIYRGYQQSQNQLRAPIFYDSNDTSYYIDPNSTGAISAIKTAGGAQIGTSTAHKLTVAGNGNYMNINYDQIWNAGGNLHLQYSSSGNIDMNNGGGYAFSRTSLRAPVFYDYNNTNFYTDPNSISVMYRVKDDHGNEMYTRKHSGSDFANGTLVQTDITSNTTSGASFVLEATGKSYSSEPPFSFMVQGYLYNNTIINYSGIHFGKPGFTTMKVFDYNGKLAFWWPRVSYWNSFDVHVRDAGGDTHNLVTGISNSTEPSSSKKVSVTMRVSAIHDYNYSTGNLYAGQFIDSSSTSYYLDPGSTSNLYDLQLSGSKHTYLYITPGNGYEAMVRFNGGSGSTWYVGSRTSTQLIGSTDAWHVYSQSAGTTVSGTDTAGNTFAYGSSRAPIFYDSNDTNYYIDPRTATNGFKFYSAAGAFYLRGQTHWDSQPGIDLSGGTSEFRFSSTGGNLNLRTDGWLIAHDYVQSLGQMYATIYYDQNNTGYYTDPSGLSAMHSLKLIEHVNNNPRWDFSAYVVEAQHFYGNNGSQTMYLGESNYINIRNTADIHGDARSPIYYDRANTGYYARPASSSNMYSIYTASFIQVGASGYSNLWLGGQSGNYFRFHTNNSDTYFDANVGNIYWRQGSSTRFYFYMTTANMTINGTLTQNSDERVKENIVEIPNALEKIDAMRGVYYNRTDVNTEVKKIGVIAQEVETVLPEVILEAPDTGLKSVAYAELTAVLINGIKEQQAIIDDLKARIETLENQ